ncbi:TIGR04282 family arsenosugar biosynthesis glycosyltransferase [Pseudonocardia sp. CA-107938]|uniref:TIGR04282 family arsenosugar biosynthesis glycosyltransferase n=1 Tax=Pseudonocardia sp. CA-107938 TaxID=3240021 RepID=UPI003D8A41BB
MTAPFALIVLAKAPVPGRVKTRLCPPATRDEAAELAAAALLDTLAAASAVPGALPVVALAGNVGEGARAAAVAGALGDCTVIGQRGAGLGARIAAAHADAAALLPGRSSLQIGMDTPQVDPALLGDCAARLARADAVLGPADDGGWWLLGLRDPRAATLIADVPTSRDDTGAATLAALRAGGLRVAIAPQLRDVDTAADAAAVAALAPRTRFAAAAARVLAVPAR